MKKIAAMLLCMVMAFSLVGCGGGTDNSKDTSSQNDTTNAGSEADSQPDTANAGSEADSQPDTANAGSQADSQPDTANAGSQAVTGGDALSMMTTIWDKFPEENKFFAFGGSAANPVDDAPAKVDLTDTDTLTNQFMIPSSVLSNADDIATLMHAMNANNFTGGAIHVTNGDAAGAAAEMQTSILGAQYMCGFPEKAVILTTGDYVVYAFGLTEILDTFKTVVTENLDGVTVVYDGLIE